VLPGFVDLNASLREPGYEHKATIASETKAAVAAGYTTVCCLPNTKPILDTPSVVQLVMDKAADAGYANDTVTTFCSDYASGVYPILGRDRPAKNQVIKEFAEFTTQAGTVGYRILVDHYKDRIAPVLRREWAEEAGLQKKYHFNAPVDLTDKQLKELTVETRREKTDDKGNTVYEWHRPGNARNELWDLLVYGHAAVEILAWGICIQHFELETIDWPTFWDYLESEALYYTR